MRVSAQTKAVTREKILAAARRLFSANGYEATTTRDIAGEAGIASGTLFNYFPTKEAIVASLALDAIGAANERADDDRGDAGGVRTLEEDLFALIAAGLRSLKPLRRHLPALLETSLSPLAVTGDEEPASLRATHLESVLALAARHGCGELPATALQLYWTLYTGVLVFWANDKSSRQEDTLALTDDSVNMFVGWLREQTGPDPDAIDRD